MLAAFGGRKVCNILSFYFAPPRRFNEPTSSSFLALHYTRQGKSVRKKEDGKKVNEIDKNKKIDQKETNVVRTEM